MDLGLGDDAWLLQEVEIAAVVRSADMLREHRPIAAWVASFRPGPCGFAASQFFVRDLQVDYASRNVDFDQVTRTHEGERAPDKALRGHVQDACAIARAAHAQVRDADSECQ